MLCFADDLLQLALLLILAEIAEIIPLVYATEPMILKS